jgi:hypothetical protein
MHAVCTLSSIVATCLLRHGGTTFAVPKACWARLIVEALQSILSLEKLTLGQAIQERCVEPITATFTIPDLYHLSFHVGLIEASFLLPSVFRHL